MTRPVPVAVPVPGLPLADPTDRATYAARKLEHLRWEKEDLAPGALALAQVAKDNADDAYANAVLTAADVVTAATQAAAAAANAALSATNAGAALWVTGTTYAVGDVRHSPVNSQIYRRKTAGAGSVDPSLDATNWSPANSVPAAALVLLNYLYGAF